MDTQQHHETDDNTFAKEALICEIGVKLTKAREKKGLSKEQVLKELKFNASFLDALESGQWSEMPGEVYAIGFLKQYAALLGIDVSHDIERIKTNTYELTIPLTFPDAPISPNRTWAIVAVLLFIVGVIASNLWNHNASDSNNTISHTTISPHTKALSQTTMANHAAADVYADIPHQPEAQTKEKNTSAEPLLTIKEQKQTAPHDQTKHTLHAYTFIAVTDDVWLQIYEHNEGQEPILKREALLRHGQRFSLDNQTQLLLTSGKPRALKILRDGEVLYDVNTLGEEDKVLKRFKL